MSEEESHFLDNPEAQNLYHDHLNDLVTESDRGAVIVGADILDAKLLSLLESKFIDGFSNTKKKEIFDFSGPLGSLSSKINMAYAFGFISETTRNSAHTLRDMRNLAAHTNASFSLRDNSTQIRRVYELGDGVPVAINRMALEVLVKDLVSRALDINLDDGRKAFETPIQVLDYLDENPNLIKPIDEKVFRMEFAIGLILLCALIIDQTVERK